jgi:hypothetical protein
MAAAIANAILDSSRQADDTALVDTAVTRQAMSSVLAMLLKAEPVLTTPALLEEACQLFAVETLIQATAMREEFALTGRRPWDAINHRQQ